MTPSSACPAPRTPSAYWRCNVSSSVVSSRSVMPITPFIGVRISWLIVARNVDLARDASSAASRASASSWRALVWAVRRRAMRMEVRAIRMSIPMTPSTGRVSSPRAWMTTSRAGGTRSGRIARPSCPRGARTLSGSASGGVRPGRRHVAVAIRTPPTIQPRSRMADTLSETRNRRYPRSATSQQATPTAKRKPSAARWRRTDRTRSTSARSTASATGYPARTTRVVADIDASVMIPWTATLHRTSKLTATTVRASMAASTSTRRTP